MHRKRIEENPNVAGSLREALNSLNKDRKFLTAGGVFTDDQIDAYIELKMKEVEKYEQVPHAVNLNFIIIAK